MCANAGRHPSEVELIAVSKQHPSSCLLEAYDHGQRHFGENYVQEAVNKIQTLQKKDIIWHFIGPIQSNKTRDIAEHFQWVHTIDREKIVARLNSHRNSSTDPLNVLIQVNIDNESTKSGVKSDSIDSLVECIIQCSKLRLRGLMAIPNPDKHDSLDRLKQHFDRLKAKYPNQMIDTLSMGMSNDLSRAIQSGSTMVRIGRAIFGDRVS